MRRNVLLAALAVGMLLACACAAAGCAAPDSHGVTQDWERDDEAHWHACLDGCGRRYGEEEHQWTYSGREPTCLSIGYSAKTCSVCGFADVEEYPALGHDFVQRSATSQAHWYACTRCGEMADVAVHNWDAETGSRCLTCGFDLGYTAGFHFFASEGTDGCRVDFDPEWWGAMYPRRIIVPARLGESPVCEIAEGAFARHGREMEEIVIPDSVTKIGANAFAGCSKLQRIELPAVTELGDCAFRNCSALTEITIPASVRSIGKEAFAECFALQKVVLEGTPSAFGEDAFADCPVRELYISDLAEWCGASFANAEASPINSSPDAAQAPVVYLDGVPLKQLHLPAEISAVPSYAFFVPALEEIVLDGQTVQKNAFFGNAPSGAEYGLVRLAIVGSGTVLEDNAFDSNGVQTIAVTGRNVSIGANAFSLSLVETLQITGADCALGDRAFYGCRQLRSAELADGVSLGDSAFYNCDLLERVTFLGDAKRIGKAAFYSCDVLRELSFGGGVDTFENAGFSECPMLETVKVDDLAAWSEIDFAGFGFSPLFYAENFVADGYTGTALVIPDGTERIGQLAFEGLYELESLTIPASVKSIGSYAFLSGSKIMSVYISDVAAWCAVSFGELWLRYSSYGTALYVDGERVTDLVIPEGVESINAYAFFGMELASISFPASLKEIGREALEIPEGIDRIYLSDIAAWCAVEWGEDDKNFLLNSYPDKTYYLNGEPLTDLVIPEGVQTIPSYAFSRAKDLKTLTVADSVREIGENAFYWTDLQEVHLGKGLRSIGKDALNCSALGTITISEENPVFAVSGNCLFGRADKLLICAGDGAVIPADGSVTAIAEDAFRGTEIAPGFAIPAAICSIGKSAFYGTDWTQSPLLTIPGTVTEMEDSAFGHAGNLEEIVLEEGVERIGKDAFSGTRLKRIVIPSSLVEIGEGAFDELSSDAEIFVAEGNPYYHVAGNNLIDRRTRSVVAGVTPQTLPADGSVTAIGAWAYYSSDFGGIIELPACVTEIGAYAFRCNYNITGVVLLPQQHVGDSAFRGFDMTVYFYGTEEAWQAYCDALAAEGRTLQDLGLSSSSITVYFYSEQEPPKTADGQLYAGFYWRYVDGVPTVWKL